MTSHLTGLARPQPPRACKGHDEQRDREAAWCAGLFVLPMVYSVAYLWLRADAVLAWGDTGSLHGLVNHLAGGTFRDALNRSPRAAAFEVPETMRRALRQLPPPAWLLLIPGTFAISSSRAGLALVLGVWLLLLTLFISTYPVAGREDYLQGMVIALALIAGWGAASTWDWAATRLRDRGTRAGLALVAAGLFARWAVGVGHDVSLRGDTSLLDEARATLTGMPEYGMVDVHTDRELFPLWYVIVVLHEREDLTIINSRAVSPRILPHP